MGLGVLGLISSTVFNGLVFAGVYRFVAARRKTRKMVSPDFHPPVSLLKPVHGAEDFPSLHWMVRAGLGVAPCSLLLAEGLPRGLVCKPLRPAPETLGIHAIWRGKRPEPCADRLIKKLLHAFRK